MNICQRYYEHLSNRILRETCVMCATDGMHDAEVWKTTTQSTNFSTSIFRISFREKGHANVDMETWTNCTEMRCKVIYNRNLSNEEI